MMSMSELNKAIYGKNDRHTVIRELYKRGILHKNGIPTAQQIAQGNFKLEYRRSVHGRSGTAKTKVLVTDKGFGEIARMLK